MTPLQREAVITLLRRQQVALIGMLEKQRRGYTTQRAVDELRTRQRAEVANLVEGILKGTNHEHQEP